jgi:hypothetical protein
MWFFMFLYVSQQEYIDPLLVYQRKRKHEVIFHTVGCPTISFDDCVLVLFVN